MMSSHEVDRTRRRFDTSGSFSTYCAGQEASPLADHVLRPEDVIEPGEWRGPISRPSPGSGVRPQAPPTGTECAEVLASGSTTYRQRVDGGRNPAAGVKRAYFIYEPPDTSGDQHALGEQARLQTDRRVVEVTVRWIESPHSTAAGLPRLSGESGRVIIVQRVIPAASAKDSTGALEESESDSIATRVQNAIDDYMSKRLVEPGWEKFAQGWTTPVCEDMAAGAESISGLHDQLHQLILGKTVESLTGLEPISNIAAEFALPGDTWLTTAKLLVEGIGIGIGLASGQPLLVNACMKALTHDAALKAVSKGIGGLLTETLDPAEYPRTGRGPRPGRVRTTRTGIRR